MAEICELAHPTQLRLGHFIALFGGHVSLRTREWYFQSIYIFSFPGIIFWIMASKFFQI
jgi:hypothetical protein